MLRSLNGIDSYVRIVNDHRTNSVGSQGNGLNHLLIM